MVIRRLAMGLAFALCSVSITFLACSDTTASARGPFPDVPDDHRYASAISDLSDRGIVEGYADGRFGPDGLVLRQQFAKMIVSALRWEVTEADRSPFVDVEDGGPATLYPDNFVAVAASRGVIVGTGQGRFSPERHLTRAQLVTMVVRALDSLAPGPLPDPRSDSEATWAGVGPEHVSNVRWAESEGLLAGLPLKDLAPGGEASRGEVAQVLHNLALDVRYHGATGDGVTDDSAAFHAALAAARAGDTVHVPAATYRIETSVELKSGVTLSGPGAVLYMPAQADDEALLDVSDTSGVTILGLTLRSDAVLPHSYVHGVGGAEGGVVDLTVRDLRTEDLKYGVKIGSSGRSSGVAVQDWTARGDLQSLYLGNVTGGDFRNLDLQCVTRKDFNNHNVYLEKGNRDISFEGLRLAGGSGYSVHLYMDSTEPRHRGRGVSFRGVRLDSPTEGIVVERYDGVSFEDVTGEVRSGYAAVTLSSLDTFVLDGFDLAGLPVCVDINGGPDEAVTNVRLSNGVYHQPNLLSDGDSVEGLVVQNVIPVPPSTAGTIRP